MNESKLFVIEKQIERTRAALEKNRITTYYAKTKQMVVPIVKQLINTGDIVGAGGSVTLSETGIMELLDSGGYTYLNRLKEGITREEIDKLYRELFSADCYFASANAITENGEIYNVDGNSNRIAALAFGPKKVVLVVGYNKIVKDLLAAEHRLKTVAAPANAKRLNCATPCKETGICADCKSDGRICCNYLIMRQQRIKDRVHVIFVGEELGY